MLSGYKTYIVSAIMILYALSGFYIGQLEADVAMQFIFNALGIAALRSGINVAIAAAKRGGK